MQFSFNNEKFQKMNIGLKRYYKYSLIFGFIGLLFFILALIVLPIDNFFGKIISLIGIIGCFAFLQLFLCFIVFCQKQKENYIIRGARLFIEDNVLHYHTLYDPPVIVDGTIMGDDSTTKQYIVEKVSQYSINDKELIINGEIKYSKNGSNKISIINTLVIPNCYTPENELIAYLESRKK